MKPNKMPFIIYADLESLIKKIKKRTSNPEKTSRTKIGKHITSWYSLSTIWAFDNIKNNHTLYGVESCIQKFCSSHRKHAVNIIHFEKKEKLPLISQNCFMMQLCIIFV